MLDHVITMSFSFMKPIKRFSTELFILSRIQFSIVRETWIWTVIMAAFFPCSTLLFFRFFTHNPSHIEAIRLVTGNIVFSIIMIGLSFLATDLASGKQYGAFVFFAALPISKLSFLASKLIYGLFNSLPGCITMFFLGEIVFGVHLHVSIWTVPVVFLSITSCSGLGAAIGFLSKNLQMANAMSQSLIVGLNYLSPVMINIHNLPFVLQIMSYAFPSTYAASALTTMFYTGPNHSVLINSVILLGYTILSILIVIWKMDWRAK